MPFDAFLKIDGIPGESMADKHKGEIDVLSFSWGVSQAKNKSDVQDFMIAKFLDKASPLLFAAACQGQSIRSAVFTLQRAGESPQIFYKVTFSDVLIASVRPGGSAGGQGDLPVEEVSLNAAQVDIQFTPQNADGTLGSPVKTACSIRH